MNRITVGILTVSDRGSRGQSIDTSGPALAEMVTKRLGAAVIAMGCVPDDIPSIANVLKGWAHDAPRPDLILTTGGTGLSPRDITPEATLSVLERRHSGLTELARLRCYEKTPRTFLSRGEAGTIAQSLVLNFPGSPRGATENLEALLDILPHAIETLRGEMQDDGRPGAKSVTGKVIEHKDA